MSAVEKPRETEPFEMDGWQCESFERVTGHAVARSAQLGDLQLCLTVGTLSPGEQLGELRLPQSVLDWLLNGRRNA
jgi:hypothetical protein